MPDPDGPPTLEVGVLPSTLAGWRLLAHLPLVLRKRSRAFDRRRERRARALISVHATGIAIVKVAQTEEWATTAACPGCATVITLDTLVVDGDESVVG